MRTITTILLTLGVTLGASSCVGPLVSNESPWSPNEAPVCYDPPNEVPVCNEWVP